MPAPKTFISYSHDSKDHKDWVANLAIRLRQAGIDAVLDQWDLKPGDDLPLYMEKNLAQSNFVLLICTDNYVKKANDGKGGVGYEKMIVTAEMMKNIESRKIIPIMRNKDNLAPTFISSKLHIDFSLDEMFESSFDDLARALLHSPVLKKPKLGQNPYGSETKVEDLKRNDPEKQLLEAFVKCINNSLTHTTNTWVYPEEILETSKMSKVLFIHTLRRLQDKKIINETVSSGHYYLTPLGLDFIQQLGLLK